MIKVYLMERNEVYLMDGVKETLKCVTAKYVPAESVDEWLKEHNSKLDFYGNRWWVKEIQNSYHSNIRVIYKVNKILILFILHIILISK